MPDLILLDLKMPTMDGVEFLQKWKTDLGFTKTRFIVMTAERSREIVDSVLRMGISDYLAKPFSGKDFLSRVSRHIVLHKRQNLPSAEPEVMSGDTKPDLVEPETPMLSLRSLRVLTTSSEEGYPQTDLQESSLHEIICKYQILTGSRSAYLKCLLVELLQEGKVCIQSNDLSERIELKYPHKKIDSRTATALLSQYFEEERFKNQTDSNATQRIILTRPMARNLSSPSQVEQTDKKF
jgi:CheY-like chemotaxis protein